MDADSLRLILLGLGILLVLGIYLWDRLAHLRARPRSHARPQATPRRAPRFDPDEEQAEPTPTMAAAREAAAEPEVTVVAASAGTAAAESEPLQLTEWDRIELDAEPALSPALNFDAHGGSDYLHAAPDLADELPRKIVQINLVAKDGMIHGAALAKAVKEVDLKAGAMDIYHRYDSQLHDQVLFSMASLIEPGSFPLKAMQSYTTAGVVLFTQLPGVRDGLAIYADMLFTAERLAALLDVEPQDETHSRLTKQSIEHTRAGILEHRRQLQLARSRG